MLVEKTPEFPLDCKIKPVNPKGDQHLVFIGKTVAEAEAPILGPPDADSRKDLDAGKTEHKRRIVWQRMRWLYSITDSVDMNLSKLQKIVEDRGAWHAAVHGFAKSRTQLSNCATTTKVKCTLSSVQSLSHVQLFVTPWTAAQQVSLSITNSWSLLRLMSIELVMPTISSSAVPFFSCPQSFPASGSFPVS